MPLPSHPACGLRCGRLVVFVLGALGPEDRANDHQQRQPYRDHEPESVSAHQLAQARRHHSGCGGTWSSPSSGSTSTV